MQKKTLLLFFNYLCLLILEAIYKQTTIGKTQIQVSLEIKETSTTRPDKFFGHNTIFIILIIINTIYTYYY